MALEDFRKSVIELRAALSNAEAKEINLNKSAPKSKVYDFSKSKDSYYRNAVLTSLDQIKARASSISHLADADPENGALIDKIKGLVAELDISDSKDKMLAKILDLTAKLTIPKIQRLEMPSKIPSEIRQDVYADIEEIQKAFTAGCYRSASILCGRILEVALHRKYFEATGIDLLEKSPGIGLGKIVAKLSEKNITFDPGLMQQVHLINNVRISSVHVKQEPFNPSKTQAEAMILYTLDILEKIFKKND